MVPVWRTRKSEARKILVGREAGGLHIMGDPAHFMFRHLSFEQLREYRDGRIKRRCSLFKQIADALGHPSCDEHAFGVTTRIVDDLHIIVDTTTRIAAKHTEGVPVSVEQHLVGLLQIGSHQKRTAMRQFGMSDLKFHTLTANHGSILAPVKLERFLRLEHQGHKSPAPSRLLCTLPICFPGPPKDGDLPI